MRFLNKKESLKLIQEKNLSVNLDEYCFVEFNDEIYKITRAVSKLDLSTLNIKRIGLKL